MVVPAPSIASITFLSPTSICFLCSRSDSCLFLIVSLTQLSPQVVNSRVRPQGAKSLLTEGFLLKMPQASMKPEPNPLLQAVEGLPGGDAQQEGAERLGMEQEASLKATTLQRFGLTREGWDSA